MAFAGLCSGVTCNEHCFSEAGWFRVMSPVISQTSTYGTVQLPLAMLWAQVLSTDSNPHSVHFEGHCMARRTHAAPFSCYHTISPTLRCALCRVYAHTLTLICESGVGAKSANLQNEYPQSSAHYSRYSKTQMVRIEYLQGKGLAAQFMLHWCYELEDDTTRMMSRITALGPGSWDSLIIIRRCQRPREARGLG